MAYLDIAQKYFKLKKTGKSYFTLCPFHEEKTPSLQIDVEKGLWHCYGCGAAGNIWQLIMKMESVSFPESVEIAKDYGVEPPANFIEKNKKTNPRNADEYVAPEEYMDNPAENHLQEEIQSIDEDDTKNKVEDVNPANLLPKATINQPVNAPKCPVRNAEKKLAAGGGRSLNKEREDKIAVYIYEDLDGKIAYEKERWEKFNAAGERIAKRFIFYHYEKAKRVPGKGNDGLILYNLKDVVKSETVFICEGEKDCDNLKKIWQEKNCAFTTNATGADSWDDMHNKLFKDKKVVVFEDNDEPGRRRSASLKTKLENTVASVKIINFDELGEHGDVSDYLDKFSIEELLNKINDKSKETEIVELKKLDVFELRFYKDKNEYILNNFLPLKKGKTNTVEGAVLEFYVYIALILSKKYGVAFISQYDFDSLLPYFANVITRIKDRADIKDIFVGNAYKENKEYKIDIVVSTKFLEEGKGITAICPSGGIGLSDYYFKNGVIYDKLWDKVLTVENLRGKEEIRIANEKRKEENKSVFKLFKKTVKK